MKQLRLHQFAQGALAICLGMLLLMLGGCAVFGSPTPRSNVEIIRGAEDSSGKIRDADRFSMPEVWAQGHIDIEISEEFNADNGREVMKSRNIKISRKSDNEIARDVALQRSADSAALGLAGADMAAGVLPVLIEQMVQLRIEQALQRTARAQIDAELQGELGRLEALLGPEPLDTPNE